mmetsp:Transcript_45539/g.108964  ORF Transcript_45539/g.108964 Transcript_45539/m.108964 type:complete len:215 (-) Transcript_45539:154-798(-)
MREAGPKLGLQFDVRWWPFFLDPTLPKEGKDKLVHYHAKFGEFRVNTMIPRMKEVGRAHGLDFSYGGMIANSMDSHRLVAWAEREGGSEKADLVREVLFRRYFSDNDNIGDKEVLAAAADESGLDRAAAASFLESEELEAEVARTAAMIQRRYNVTGVPFFVIDERFAFSGAQDSATIVHLLQQILRQKDGDDSDDDTREGGGAGGAGSDRAGL